MQRMMGSGQSQKRFNGIKPPTYLTTLVAANTKAGGDNIFDLAIDVAVAA